MSVRLRTQVKNMKSFIAVFFSLLSVLVFVSAGETPIVGKLGKPIGTELTVEGTFQAGKNSWILVKKVNGEKLPAPILIATGNLDPFSRIPTNTVCQFKGKEITSVMENQFDPKTGTTQQAAPGRHFVFEVTEVLAPKGIKVKDSK
jgi:hypothetical protein